MMLYRFIYGGKKGGRYLWEYVFEWKLNLTLVYAPISWPVSQQLLTLWNKSFVVFLSDVLHFFFPQAFQSDDTK